MLLHPRISSYAKMVLLYAHPVFSTIVAVITYCVGVPSRRASGQRIVVKLSCAVVIHPHDHINACKV